MWNYKLITNKPSKFEAVADIFGKTEGGSVVKTEIESKGPIQTSRLETKSYDCNGVETCTSRTHDTQVIEKWWEEEGGTIVTKRRKDDVSTAYCPRSQRFVEVPFDSWTGSPEKDIRNAQR